MLSVARMEVQPSEVVTDIYADIDDSFVPVNSSVKLHKLGCCCVLQT